MLFIKNGYVLTMEGKVYEKASILIRDGKIQEIGEELVAPLDAVVIDAAGKIITPGLIDAHCHLGLWEDAIGFEGADGNEMTDPVTPHMRAIDAINPMDRTFEEARQGGITSVATGPGSGNVIGGQFAAIKTWGKRIDDMILQEPLAMKCAFGENPKRVYHDRKQSPSTRMGTAAILRGALYKAKEYSEKLEAAKEDPSKKPGFDMKMEALLPVIRKEIPLKAHAHRADDIFTAIRIAKELGVNITLEHCTEGHLIVEDLKKEGLYAIVGPSLSERSKYELKNLTFETAGILSKAGVKIAIMTDHPVIPLQYLPMCAALAVKAGMDETEALKAITIHAAEILGIDSRVGSIKEGKDADLVIWEGHPFELQSKAAYTIINGEVVHQQ
ncbi:amidohydrolase [Geosporobacter ferrireducens]|uniref:amidohydrolase n=1 Tax=Geosporobacter ferrireducens TaxID=1424294 RepID=UPI00139E5325|nr:amidohydrolase [Geosporobacter ferrireducens]MTI53453.1 amidohydrolase [Geosporobacter ferrireducens]